MFDLINETNGWVQLRDVEWADRPPSPSNHHGIGWHDVSGALGRGPEQGFAQVLRDPLQTVMASAVGTFERQLTVSDVDHPLILNFASPATEARLQHNNPLSSLIPDTPSPLSGCLSRSNRDIQSVAGTDQLTVKRLSKGYCAEWSSVSFLNDDWLDDISSSRERSESTMPHLTLSLFGPIRCTREDAPVQFAYDKVQALLAYLATESDRPHRRAVLAGLLWPDQDESVARHNLNQALWSLRRSIDDRDLVEPAFLSSRDSIQLSPGANCTIDIQHFQALLDRVDRHTHRNQETCQVCLNWLTEAVEIYRGSFLEQLSLTDSPEFEEWVVVRRERFHQLVVNALDRLVEQLERQGELQRATAYLRRLLHLDPWREDSHRRLMRLLALTGQRAAALAHFDRVREILEQELGADVEQETIQLRDEIERGEIEAPKPPSSVPVRTAPASRLPSTIISLVGRERLLSDLASLMASGQHRLVTLIGPGGIGKTSVALRLAHDQEKSFRDGAGFVPLASTASAASLIQSLSDALAVPTYGNRDPREQLLSHLREMDLLLVLDNFEHLLPGAGLVSDILTEAPGVQVLVTSRERLNLYGEHVVPILALDIPSIMDEPSNIGRSSSVQLFVRSAERANASVQFRAADFPAIIRICELVGGMPLGIELAAAWTPLLTCHEIAAEIERGLDFLSTSLRDVPERHRSVRAAFDHSWRLLPDHERDVFMRLSVFRGGFQKDAAELITRATLPVLLALMSKSFLNRGDQGRFEIHELLRQYGAAKLAEATEKHEAASDAHARYYAAFLLEREQRLRGSGYLDALADLAIETENIRAAWRWALNNKRVDILKTLVPVWLSYEVMGRYHELRTLQTEAIAILEASGVQAEVALALAMSRRAATLLRVGDRLDSEILLRRSNEILLRHGECAEAGLNLNFLAMKAHAEEAYYQERAILEESLVLTRKGEDHWATAYSLNDLGMVESQLGDLDRAERLIKESLEIFDQIGDGRGKAFALNNLGVVTCRHGLYDESRRLHEASLGIRRSLNNPWGAAQSLTQMGRVARLRGDHAEADARLREALRVARELHAYPLLLDALVEIAELMLARGEHDHALSIMARVAGHPASSPSMIANVQHLREEHGNRRIAVAADESAPTPSDLSLETVIALALGRPADEHTGNLVR